MKHNILLVLACLLSLVILLPACGQSSGLDLEREEIVSFTQQALEIEAKRNELNSYIGLNAGRQSGIGLPGLEWYVNYFFLSGFSQEQTIGRGAPHPELEGMTSLKKRVLFLDCPQSMRSIKNIIDDIYSSEVELAKLQLQGVPCVPGAPFFGQMFVLPEVNQHNIEFWLERYKSWQVPASSSTLLMNHPWVELQLLRREVYTRWTEILREHGIDPAEEGFTELIDLE